MKKLIYGLMLLFLFGPVFTSAQQTKLTKISLTGEDVQSNSADLEKSFSQFDLVKIDFSELREKALKNDVFQVDLNLGEKHQWNLVLVHHDMRASAFKQTIGRNGILEKEEKTRAITFKGYINRPGSSGEPIRFNISDDFINGYVVVDGEELFIEPASMTDKTAAKDQFVIYRSSDVTDDEEHTCSVDLMQKNRPFQDGELEFDLRRNNDGGAETPPNDCIEVEFATGCTYDFVVQQGSVAAANTQITAITNLMEGLYAPFNIDYVIVDQFAPATLADDPFTASVDAVTLLNSFGPWAGANLATHDIGQLWVARNISGCGTGTGLVGCAWIGQVCQNLRYSVCEHYTTNTNCLRVLSAHEVGHNWSATHDAGGSGFIMAPSITCNATTFSGPTTTQIQNHIDTRTCLGTCCELVVDCSNIRDRRVECWEDIPPANLSLPIIVESCGPVTVTFYELSSFPQGPGTLVRVYTITDSEGNTANCSQTFQVNGIGWVKVIDIDNTKNPCLESVVCFKGEYRICNDVDVLSFELVFKQDGLEVASTPIDTYGGGTWYQCKTKQQLLQLGLSGGEAYDVCVRITTNFGTITSPAFVAGLNNDFKFVAYDAEIIELPDCVKEGEPFEVVVSISGWINSDQIEAIYSTDPNFTYCGPVPPPVQWTIDGRTIVKLTFKSNTCSCEGEMLAFDIRIKGCAIPIWLMTDNIPCCAEPCKDVAIKDWKVSDCFYYNGGLARQFKLIVSSPDAILDIVTLPSTDACETITSDVTITQVGGNYCIEGYIRFVDGCTYQADVNIAIQTEDGCCTIQQQFSFPEGCTYPKGCEEYGPADVQLIYYGNPPVMTVSLGLPLGTNVTVTNNNTGAVQNASVGKISCGPFWIDQNGNIGGGTSCPGIKFELPNYNCKEAGQNTTYSYTIAYGDCIWVITGDYCRETTSYPVVVDTGGDKDLAEGDAENRSFTPETVKSDLTDGSISVYPNPIQSSELINFDLSKSTVGVKTIRITDMSGKLIETIFPQQGVKVFSHRMAGDLKQGVYFVVFDLKDGRVESKKLISLQ